MQSGDITWGGQDICYHLKLASGKPSKTICFTGFLVHSILPDSIVSAVLVPIIKDKAGKINSCENY